MLESTSEQPFSNYPFASRREREVRDRQLIIPAKAQVSVRFDQQRDNQAIGWADDHQAALQSVGP